MKKLHILLFTLAALTFFSCEDDDNLTIKEEITPPVLEALTPENIVITEDMNLYDKIAYWHWKAPDYGFQAAVQYTVQADTTAAFSMPYTIGTSNATSIDITTDMLNKAGAAFAEESLPITLFVRLRAAIDTDEFGTHAPIVYSNSQMITFTPLVLEKPQKAAVYITGSLIEGLETWKNEISEIGKGLQVFFSDDSSMDNRKYSYTGTFVGASEFKIISEAGIWGTAYAHDGDGKIVQKDPGNNIPGPASSGLYTLSVDFVELSYKFTPYTGEVSTYNRIGVAGDATPTGWDNDTEMNQVTPHIWTLEMELTAGELKFRVDNKWDTSWGGTDLPFGIGDSSGESKNLVIEKAGNYLIAFNDLTKQYVIMRKDRMP